MDPTSSAWGRPWDVGLGPARDRARENGGSGVRTAFEVFLAAAESVPTVRAWTGQQLRCWDVDAETCECVQLLVSELAANAVRHAKTCLLEVRLSVGPVLEVSVRDQDPRGCLRAGSPGPEEDAGRGLAIVEAVADAWGTVRDETGKSVWFRLDLPSEGAWSASR